jgi:hypothetical protein
LCDVHLAILVALHQSGVQRASGVAYLEVPTITHAYMTLGDVLPILVGWDQGQLYYPKVQVKPPTFQACSRQLQLVSLCRGSFFEMRTVGADGDIGFFKIQIQPYRADIRSD